MCRLGKAVFRGCFFISKCFVYLSMIKAILISWFWTKFEPVKWLIDSFKFKNNLIQFAWEHLICPKCIGFWLGLALTQNIYLAIISSICTAILHKLT